MAQITIKQQEELMERTKEFVEKYGISKKWLAAKVGISVRDFSYFINSRFAIPQCQYDRLLSFVDEWEKCMSTFSQL